MNAPAKVNSTLALWFTLLAACLAFLSLPVVQSEPLTFYAATFAIFGILPAFVARGVFREALAAHGVRLGDWRYGLKGVLAGFIVAGGATWFSSFDPEFLREYPHSMSFVASPAAFAGFSISILLFYGGWEFFLRGFVLFGLEKRTGAFNALMVQTLISTLLHIGKPSGELLGAAPAAFFMGWLTLRTRSILYALLFHWSVGLVNTWLCGVHRL